MAPSMFTAPQAKDQDQTIQDRRPVVTSGPSGVGKGTLAQKLGEVEGVSYYFVSVSEFESLISHDAFVEYTLFSGHYYGTSKRTISEQTAKGAVVLLDIEMQGLKRMKMHSGFDARYIFIKPPSMEVLEARLRSRGTETEESIQKRLMQTQAELEYAKTPGVHDIVIVNDKIEEAFQKLENYIFG
ncbi:guanylate kinase [Xylaria digitata]|nr:guanylate kinase [Xylaria digitata]